MKLAKQLFFPYGWADLAAGGWWRNKRIKKNESNFKFFLRLLGGEDSRSDEAGPFVFMNETKAAIIKNKVVMKGYGLFLILFFICHTKISAFQTVTPSGTKPTKVIFLLLNSLVVTTFTGLLLDCTFLGNPFCSSSNISSPSIQTCRSPVVRTPGYRLSDFNYLFKNRTHRTSIPILNQPTDLQTITISPNLFHKQHAKSISVFQTPD